MFSIKMQCNCKILLLISLAINYYGPLARANESKIRQGDYQTAKQGTHSVTAFSKFLCNGIQTPLPIAL